MYEIIRRTLDGACRLFSNVGVIHGEDDGAYRVYQHQPSSLTERRFELIVLPTRPGLDWSTFRPKRATMTPTDDCGDLNVTFVDCFQERGEHPEPKTMGMRVLSPNRFWYNISGIERYRFGLEESHDKYLVNQEYLDRSVVPIRADQLGRVREGESTGALETLLRWGQGMPVGGESVLIFGERGSGKTWLLLRFALEQLKRHLESPWKTPPAFYLSLQKYADALLSAQGVRKTLAYFFHDYYPSIEPANLYIWESLIESGAAILLLDGFDELAREVTDSSMVRHLERLNFLLPHNARAVLTTRGTVFPSLSALVSAFSGVPHVSDKSQVTGDEFLLGEDVATNVRAHAIYSITPFSKIDLAKLAQRNGLVGSENEHAESTDEGLVTSAEGLLVNLLTEMGDVNAINGEMRLQQNNSDAGDAPILDACRALGTIPACAHYMLSVLEQRKSRSSRIPYLRLFEMSLLGPLVYYNIATQRSLDYFEYRVPATGDIAEQDIDVAQKLDVLGYIAWKIAESRQNEFDPDYIGAAALDSPSTGFRAVVNDLRSQTVFTFSESGRGLKFRLKEIHAYFVARSIFFLLCNEWKILDGVARVGRYNWTDTDGIEGAVGAFLRTFAREGMLIFRSSQQSPDEFCVAQWHPDKLPSLCNDFVKSEPAYSMRTRFLKRNLEMLEVAVPDALGRLDWDNRPIGASDASFQAALAPGEGVLIPGDTIGVSPFLISCHEVRNKDFDEFLSSEWVPYLEADADDYEVRFRKRQLGAMSFDEHPLSWRTIHRGSDPKEFAGFTNDYHLFGAIEMGHFPNDKADHPVVWVSAYVAAIYLNWKTMVSGYFNESDCYYRVLIDRQRRPRIAQNHFALGYRLPTSDEWLFAARANDQFDAPWDRYLKSGDPELRAKGERLEYFLTQLYPSTKDVWASVENDFGAFGMLGNVREWADVLDSFDKPGDDRRCRCQVVGATSALGVDTFKYSYEGIPLFPGNTNPDVGFRWARSVSQDVAVSVELVQKQKLGKTEKSLNDM